MHLAKLRGQRRRRHAVTDLPARAVVGLAKRTDHEAARGQFGMARHALVQRAVEDHVFVDLVRQHHNRGVAQQGRELLQVGRGEYRAGRIVRRVHDEHARARRDRVGQALPVDRETGALKRHANGARLLQFDRRHIAVVGRIENNHFITGTDRRRDRREDGLGGTRGNRDLGIGIGRAPIERFRLFRHLLTQRRNADSGRVLIASVGHRARQRLAQRHRRFEIRKPLTEIHRVVFLRQLAHHTENGRADLRQLGFDLHEESDAEDRPEC